MATRIFLHVGLPKSGTSYLQAVLAANQDALRRDAGLLFPGDTWLDQVRGVRDVREMRVPPGEEQEHVGAWQALVDEANRWSGDVIISMEWLCAAEPRHVDTVVSSFGPAEVHVLVTVRDLGRTIPAAWQEAVKNGRARSWPAYLDLILDERSASMPGGRRFWRQQDVGRVIDRWTQFVPSDRTHVVTVPPSGAEPGALWSRVCTVLGLDASAYRTEGLTRNESLTLESVELLRRLVPLLKATGVPRERWAEVVKERVTDADVGATPAGTTLALPAEHHAATRDRAEQLIDAVRRSGVHVVGDLDELVPRLGQGQGRTPAEVSTEELLAVAEAYLVRMIVQEAERHHPPP